MTFYHLAFFMGLIGSVHCVMMCGPLMLAIPQHTHSNFWSQIGTKSIYQFGRILTYSILGFLIAYIGSLSTLIKNGQQGISLVTGILLILIGIMSWLKLDRKSFYEKQNKIMQPLYKFIGYWLYRPGGHFIAGLLNGLLPCGMVYMALASALNAESPTGGALFMFLFGVGTIPLLLLFTLLATYGKNRFKFNFNKWLPSLFVLMGLWFILRGANLNIAFLSPLIYPEGALYCN